MQLQFYPSRTKKYTFLNFKKKKNVRWLTRPLKVDHSSSACQYETLLIKTKITNTAKSLLHGSTKYEVSLILKTTTFNFPASDKECVVSPTFTHTSVILMSCHPARGWANRLPQSLHRRQGSRRRTQSICHNKSQHWRLLFLNIWRCWPFISCFLGAQPAHCRSREVVYTKHNISNITEAPAERKQQDSGI